MISIRGSLLSLSVILLTCTGSYAGDWPQFKRDAARTGNAAEEELSFPMKRIVAIQLPAPIYASPAVVAGRAYVQDARGNMVCVDVAKNKLVWHTKIDGLTNHSSPAVVSGLVFVGSNAGHFAILDAKSGELKKKIPCKGAALSSPAITKDAVYLSSVEGSFIRLDHSGNLIWQEDLISALGDFAVKDNYVYGQLRKRGWREGSVKKLEDTGKGLEFNARRSWTFGVLRGGVCVGDDDCSTAQTFDSETGKFNISNWQPKSKQHYIGVRGDTTFENRVTSSYREGHFFRGDRCFDLAGSIAWQAEEAIFHGGGFNSSPALSKQYQVIGTENGVLYFHRLNSAEMKAHIEKNKALTPRRRKAFLQKARWSFATGRAGKVNGGIISSPAIADGQVFFGGEDGVLYGLGQGKEAAITEAVPGENLDTRTFTQATGVGHEWHTPLGDFEYNAVSKNKTLTPPYALKWKTKTFSTFKAPPSAANGRLFLAGRNGGTLCLDAQTGEIIWRENRIVGESRPGAVYADGYLVKLSGTRHLTIFSQGKDDNGGLW